MPFNPVPKPVKRTTTKRKRDVALNANTGTVRERVFDRDGHRCRLVPGCLATESQLELVHLEDRGMGGNPDGSRDTTANTVCGCREHHRGARSVHSGHLQWRFLSKDGADGKMVFEFYESIGRVVLAATS